MMREAVNLPSVEQFKAILSYNPETGVLIWRKRSAAFFSEGTHSREAQARGWNAKFAGKPAGSTDKRGYVSISAFGNKYRAHRVAWALHYGAWPSGEIDHTNHNRSDNRIANLRDVSGLSNQRNRSLPHNNNSGCPGVYYRKDEDRWRARIWSGGKYRCLGAFKTFEGAVRARKAAERKHGFHENHGKPNPIRNLKGSAVDG